MQEKLVKVKLKAQVKVKLNVKVKVKLKARFESKLQKISLGKQTFLGISTEENMMSDTKPKKIFLERKWMEKKKVKQE